MFSSLRLIVAAAFLLVSEPAASSTVYRAAGVTRHLDGDTFYLKKDGVAVSCTSTLCADSRALPSSALGPGVRRKDDPPCVCKCPANSPTFREDLHVCVDDFHECSLATFQNSQKTQKIPFVFLPMKGQIIHPSSDIVFNADVGEDPICVVSSAQFLTRSGWLELRNTSDTEPPLRLFRDQRHTFLQWLGEQDLRFGMEGRILLARLMCKDPSGVHHSSPTDDGQGVITHTFSTPCIAFRVAGSQGAREVSFTSDYSLAGTGGGLLHGLMGHENSKTGLSTLEYLAVGLCIMLLCLVYATSVIVYIHVRRIRRKKKRSRNESGGDDSDSERGHAGYSRRNEMNLMSEGVIKNNPLLMAPGSENFTKLPSLFHKAARSIRLPRGNLPEAMEHDEESSADEQQPQNSPRSEHSNRPGDENNPPSPVLSKTSEIKVQIHPESSSSNEPGSSSSGDENQHSPNLQTSGIYTLTLQPSTESGSLERHPGESVSIVETWDEANSKEGRDFSFLGVRHSFNSSSMGLPDAESGCNGNCNGSSSHSGSLMGSAVGRRKLYFNPAYFEPEMLQSPPPAAIEFLQKLREVVAMSKLKIAAKKYNPSLIGIPEESNSVVSSRTSQSVNGYTKQENWQIDHAPAAGGASGSSLLPNLDVCGSKQQTIRRWLEDLDSGEPVEDQDMPEKVADQLPPIVKTPSLEAPTKPRRGNVRAPQPKKLMDAVIKELVRERGLAGEDIPSSETTTSGEKSLDSIHNEAEENHYEFIAVNSASNATANENPTKRPPLMMYCLPELLAKTSGYNLVSEVYVNDEYSCSSNQSSSSNSTINRHTIKHRPPKNSIGTPSDTSSPSSSVSENLEGSPETENYPGSLTIKLPEAAPHEYVERDEEDQFEPDTLDRVRKNSKHQLPSNILSTDSLERPHKIQLKSSGSFFADAMNEQHSWGPPVDVWNYSEAKKRRGPSSISDLRSNSNIAFISNLNKAQGQSFGSLREIFEAKRQMQLKSQFEHMLAGPPGEQQGKHRVARSLITPNELRIRAQGMDQASIDDIRQMMWSTTPDVAPKPKPKPKRQRTADVTACPPTPPPSVPPSIGSIPPSLPPKKKSIDYSQHNPPLPPREPSKSVTPPSLPPKNLRGCRSPTQTKMHQAQQQLPNLITSHSALNRASADSEEENENNRHEGNRVHGSAINDAFSKWKKTKWKQETSIKMPNRPGDSGYLSSDSNNSLKKVADEMRDQSSETDEDESLCEGGSESGAESIGTDSIFYKASPQDSQNFGEKRKEVNVLLPHGKKKVPPPPPKRVNSKLDTMVVRNNNLIKSNLNAKYGL